MWGGFARIFMLGRCFVVFRIAVNCGGKPSPRYMDSKGVRQSPRKGYFGNRRCERLNRGG